MILDCTTYNDKEIIQKVSSGNLDAFYCIVQNYEKKLLSYILRISSIERQDAENLLQEVFIKVYKNANDYDQNLSFSSWIYRITHNITIDYYRKNKDSLTLSLENEDNDYINLLESLDSGVSLEKDIKKKECIQKIKETLDILDDKYKQVLILKFLEEKSYNEISDILKIPEGSVASLINRGKKQFKLLSENTHLDSYI